MEEVRVHFLGTGNAIPTKLRNHTGIFISFTNEHILIDCGENMQRQLRIAELSPIKLTRILITHWHGDHILGLPGLLQTLAMSNYNKTLQLYGPIGSRRYFSTMLQLLHGLNINIKLHEVTHGAFVNEKDFKIEAMPLLHGIPALGYSIILKDRRRLYKKKLEKYKLPHTSILGQLQQGKDIIWNNKKIRSKDVSYIEKGKKITIILDTAFTERAVVLAKDADLLIAESTFSQEEQERAREYKHLTARDAATIAKKAKAKKLLLTHISERYEHNPAIIEREAKKVFKNTHIPKDFDALII